MFLISILESQFINKMRYLFSIGSNLGDKSFFICEMQNFLKTILNDPIEYSSLMETAPVDVNTNQESYLNQIISGYSNKTPKEVLRLSQKEEKRLGRDAKGEKLSRTADLDIIIVDDYVSDAEDLTIPHPAICERRFILEGLNELIPEFIHPVLKKSISKLFNEMSPEVKEQEIIRISMP